MSETLRDRRLRYVRTILQSRPTTTALVGETSALDGLRVLVLGTAPADTLCALMHTECRKAEARLPDAFTDAHSADLVLVPHANLANIGRVVTQAARSLDHHGRIALAVSQERDFTDVTFRALIEAGFEMPTLQAECGQTRIHAYRGESVTRN